MADYKPYVAVQEFTLNLNNGQQEVKTKYGDLIEFDGLTVKVKEFEGQARSFSKVIRDGEWVKPISPEKVGLLKQRLAPNSNSQGAVGNVGPDKPRNETGGKIVESSDVGSVKVSKRQEQSNKELQDLVNQYESDSFPDSHDDTKKTNIKNTKVEQNVPNRQPKVINEDATIVAKVSENASTDAETKNTSGVEIEDILNDSDNSRVVSNEERVVKETNYSNKEASDNSRKKLTVDTESEGVVVKKTSSPAISRTEIDENTKTDEDGLKVSKEEEVVSETSYEESKPTDIGSSTKAGVESSKKTSSKKPSRTSKKSKTKNADSGNQDAIVVGRVSKQKDVETVDGITVRNSVGTNEESSGEVEFSSGGDGIENTEATFSSSGEGVTDLSGIEASDVPLDSKASDLDAEDIDISDLLD